MLNSQGTTVGKKADRNAWDCRPRKGSTDDTKRNKELTRDGKSMRPRSKPVQLAKRIGVMGRDGSRCSCSVLSLAVCTVAQETPFPLSRHSSPEAVRHSPAELALFDPPRERCQCRRDTCDDERETIVRS